MPIDPKDLLYPSYLVDAVKFNSILGGGIAQSQLNAYTALNSTLGATAALRAALYPSSTLLAKDVTALNHFQSTALSLSTLRPTMDAVSALNTAGSYAGTMSALSTAGSIGSAMHQLAVQPYAVTSAMKFPELTLGAAAYQVGIADSLRLTNSITAPYLGSSAAVFGLESSIAKLLAGQISGLATIQASAMTAYVTSLQTDVSALATAMQSAWGTMSIDVARLSFTRTPVLRTPAVELYSAAQAAAVVSLPGDELPDQDDEIEEIIDDAVDVFESRLAALNQGLVSTYRGGNEALEGGGTDWQRHAMVSFRELTTHVLHLLAPDEKILPTAQTDDLHNGRPTRKARLNFIFAEVAGPEIAAFYEADVKAAITLFDLLNSETHRLEQRATSEQVHYLRGRVVGLLTSMLSAREL